MYAVIFCGGKQHKVVEGEKLRVELLNKEQGSTVELDKVLLISDGTNVKVGTPYIDGAKVTATVLGEVAGEKVKIVKFLVVSITRRSPATVSGSPKFRLPVLPVRR